MKTFSRNTLYYGKDEPPPERIDLRAGPLRMVYEGGDLRTVRLGEREILRRMYVAVRDRDWGTVAPVISNQRVEVGEDRFVITYDVENRQGEVDFAWHGEIRGEPDGTVTFLMDGAARATFLKNRIGFCVLHPAGLSGQEAVVEHTDGSREAAHFAGDICADQPVQPFTDLRAIAHPVEPGVWAEVHFSGDVFEMEDQRLWTDASYKTFCTPLSLPYPVEIRAGTRVVQVVTLRIRDERPAEQKEAAGGVEGKAAPVRLAVEGEWLPLPALGVSMASHGEPLSAREVERLRALNLHHLRVELAPGDPACADLLRRAAEEAGQLGAALEVALRVDGEAAGEQLAAFRRALDEVHPVVCGWLVFPASEPYQGGNPSEGIARAAHRLLKDYAPAIPLAVGTNTDFIFLKRTTPPLAWMDEVCITLNPQVHAFDNQSLVETLEAQPMVVESARRLAGGRPVVVSPITLRPRFNPYATGPQPEPPPGALPPQVDPRQMSLFGAGWTLGSLRAMVAAGARRVTYYETTGWRGVLERETGAPLPALFPSLPGGAYPLYHVLACAGAFAGGEALPLVSADPLRICGLALRKAGRVGLLLANHTGEETAVEVAGAEETWRLRALDETSAETAMRAPEEFAAAAGEAVAAREGQVKVRIQPYGFVWLEDLEG